jgi:hypothetical protein
MRSAVRKAAAVCDIITDCKLDVIALTESWTRLDNPDAITSDILPLGYNASRAFRDTEADTRTRGGEVAQIFQSSLRVKLLLGDRQT